MRTIIPPANSNYFPCLQAKELMDQIQAAMAKQIDESSWLDDHTKRLANEKLSHMSDLIGYPDWYSEQGINNYYSNVRSREFSCFQPI